MQLCLSISPGQGHGTPARLRGLQRHLILLPQSTAWCMGLSCCFVGHFTGVRRTHCACMEFDFAFQDMRSRCHTYGTLAKHCGTFILPLQRCDPTVRRRAVRQQCRHAAARQWDARQPCRHLCSHAPSCSPHSVRHSPQCPFASSQSSPSVCEPCAGA